MKTLGTKIRLLRHQKSWNQQDVARLLQISIPAFSKIETGITDLNLSRLEQISALFEMSVAQLLTFDEAGQEKQSSDLELLANKLRGRETELIDLQKKVIELYEEVRQNNQ